MAVVDVKKYYYKVMSQYLEMKQDLIDFEQALKEGFITEDQMIEAQNNVKDLEINYHRLSYIMFLLELPKNKKGKQKKLNADKKLVKAFDNYKADSSSVINENNSALDHFRSELKKLKNNEIGK